MLSLSFYYIWRCYNEAIKSFDDFSYCFCAIQSFYDANFGSSSLKNDERMPLMPQFTSPPVLVVARF